MDNVGFALYRDENHTPDPDALIKHIKEVYAAGCDEIERMIELRKAEAEGRLIVIDGKDANVPTNADRIRAMTDDELAKFIESMVDGSNSHEVACYGCINYGTHHSDPKYKGTYLYDCEGCNSEGVGLDVKKWLQKHAEEAEAELEGGDGA